MNAPTNPRSPQAAANAHEAQFLAPKPSPRAGGRQASPAELRNAIDRLDRCRQRLELSRDQWLTIDVRTRLLMSIETVLDLVIEVDPRFGAHKLCAHASIEAAFAVIDRWAQAQAECSVATHSCAG